MTTRYYEITECEHGQVGNHQMPGVDVFEHGDVRCPGGQRRELTDVDVVEWCEVHRNEAWEDDRFILRCVAGSWIEGANAWDCRIAPRAIIPLEDPADG